MGIVPLGLHTALMILVMPTYIYCMTTQSFVTMRFVYARWLLGGMLAAFALGSTAMPIRTQWPVPQPVQLACVAGCWAMQGAAAVMAMRRVCEGEVASRQSFQSLVAQHS